MNDKEKNLKKNEEVKEEQEIPTYYTVLSASIRYDKRLKASEKILFSEIAFLSQKKGYCYASNRYLAKLYGVSKDTISKRIQNLKKCEYIDPKTIYKDDGKTVEERKIFIKDLVVPPIDENVYTLSTKTSIPYRQNSLDPIDENVEENNTRYINTSINKNNIYSRAEEKSDSFISEVVDYLNKKSDKNFKSNTNKTISLINARRKEGYTLGDFKKVIDTKTKQWQNDSRMNEYLRPETLFGNKFESYLQQYEPSKSSDDDFNNFLASIEARTRKVNL
ncbi:conserved phage C-terminal domain-containing protein [Anaerococcus tetradius]|uniref:Phage conserved hypothetical protein C-terminal domain-containing protein n=1 Tax=Anaerococcus tetradius TaxID=33036 RepID=A0A133KEF5_9FIRM|nr:conserved phage C-terminal domain-containing protein [Anaerococcus tetradius]KWZ77961.1 hypothetical protein HMPREF3200_01010 [Anaerococcus tetradius]